MITAKDLKGTFCYKDANNGRYDAYISALRNLGAGFYTSQYDTKSCCDSSRDPLEFNSDFVKRYCTRLDLLLDHRIKLKEGDIYMEELPCGEFLFRCVNIDDLPLFGGGINNPSKNIWVIYSESEQESFLGVDRDGNSWTAGLAMVRDSVHNEWEYVFLTAVRNEYDYQYIDSNDTGWIFAQPMITGEIATRIISPNYIKGKALFASLSSDLDVNVAFEDLPRETRQKWIDTASK